jgi:hypothetical protein
MPVSVENFDSVPESLVMFDRTCPLRSSAEVANELSAVIAETELWFEGGYSTLRDYIVSDSSKGIVLLISAMKGVGAWRLRWRGINCSSFLSINSPAKRLSMLNSFLNSIASEMQMESCHAVLEGDFVVGLETPHPRILVHDAAAAFGEKLERYEVQLEFVTAELDAVLRALVLFCDEFTIQARVSDGHGMPLERYQQWLQNFDFRPACYDYMYNGYVMPLAVDFFRSKTKRVPTGLVPFAKFQVCKNGNHLGFVEIACQFTNSNCVAILSGDNEEAIARLCELGGITETKIVYS